MVIEASWVGKEKKEGYQSIGTGFATMLWQFGEQVLVS
tara:strand:+ start:194 stop:307 length:114 start_codon:yes stop_codon:yes gene_type:complete